MAIHISNKKGQTLVEVVVALGILAIVFAGTVTLVANVLKLNLMAREKTQAVAYAQQGIANAIQGIGSNCALQSYDRTEEATLGNVRYQRVIATTNVDFLPGSEPSPNPSGNFLLVTSTVSWPFDNPTNTYEIKEIMRANK